MTNDYKTNLLEYLTGNMSIEEENTTPLYLETSVKEYDYPTFPNKQVRCKDGNGNYNGKVLYYQRLGSQISLLDENMNVLKTFTTFSSGTPLGTILNLEVDEVGNVYGLDYITVNGVITYRIILMNNISEIAKGQSDYSIVLRNSYYVQGYSAGDDINPQYETFLAKSTQSATYYFALQEGTGSLIMPSTFQINVGSANTWTRLPDILFSNGNVDIGNIYFNSNDQPVAEYVASELITNDWQITRQTATGDEEPIYSVVIENITTNYYSTSEVGNFKINLLANYYGSFFLILTGYYKSSTVGGVAQYKGRIATYLVNGTTVNKLLVHDSDIELPQTTITPSIGMGLVMDNALLLMIGQPKDNDGNCEIYFDLLAENNSTNYFIDTNQSTKWVQLALARVGSYNTYNLYNFSIIYQANGLKYILNIKTIYNQFNYNGEEHENKDMFIPRQAMLFDTNNNLIFARNLYNNKVYNNQNMATINVPNNLLNNDTISKENLYGNTNIDLVESTQSIDKNVYENLYINFINAITMENQNTDIYISNMNGATRLNQSIGKTLDYDNAKANKIRVTYDDDTSYITSANNTINDNICTYTIGVHVPNDKNIQSIEIISNDENTTYQTITNLNLEKNKYYIITQDVYVV